MTRPFLRLLRSVVILGIVCMQIVSANQIVTANLVKSASMAAGDTELVSVDSGGLPGNGGSWGPSLSSDGGLVTFYSVANNLVAGDTNNMSDVFLRDMVSGTTTLVSVSTSGIQGNDDSYENSISPDGGYVAFYSYATNLISGVPAGVPHVFVRDLNTNTTNLISVNSSGIMANDNSFITSTPAVSSNGRYVTFFSYANNLVSNDTNSNYDVFVRDTQEGTTKLVSVDSNGVQGNNGSYFSSITPDGRYIVYASDASNLVSEDTNGSTDYFLYDTLTGITTRLSVSSSGEQGNDNSRFNPVISSDGRYAAFCSSASNLVSGDTNGVNRDVFVRDVQTGTTTLVSVTTSGVQMPTGECNPSFPPVSISSDGRYVAFHTSANLIVADTSPYGDIYVHDMLTGSTTRSSIDSNGVQANSTSWNPVISPDGRFVAFFSEADNLDAGDANDMSDVFIHEVDFTAPVVSSIIRANASPTSAGIVDFIVTFSKPVLGVDVSDFILTTNGISGARLIGISGSGSSYVASVSTGYGNGTLRMDLSNNDTIQDLPGNYLDSNYTNGEEYVINKMYLLLPLIIH